jgi:hypothetical protein
LVVASRVACATFFVMSTVERVRGACERGGLDLVHPFSMAWLDEELIAHLAPPRADALGVLIGNGSRLWPALRPPWPHEPVDEHVEAVVEAACVGATLAYSHRRDERGYLPAQRLAEQARFAPLGPCHLNIHPERGPWFALRAVAIFDEAGPVSPPTIDHPCAGCDRPCVPALERAMKADGDHEAWLAVRDACPVGRDHRYPEAMIAYHYTKDRRWLPRS